MATKIGRTTNESILKATSRSWDEWLKIMEKAGARHWTHGEMTDFLKSKYKLGSWWQ